MSGRRLMGIIYLVSGILFVIFSIELYLSIESYINYFLLVEKFQFSFKTSIFLFTVPAVFYLIYLLVFPSSKKRTIEKSKKLMMFFLMLFLFGYIFSFFFSNYVEKDLLSKGYFICETDDFTESNLYVKSLMMCN
ncbi:DUF1240 domain-containing protein [Proteus sp. WDL240414]|uniref:DUF1240 domain-containing protein n=1 Tax=Proteus genomosp. 6 TaxID=1311820 RepID=A0ABV1L9X4_9GAMM|nr:DUF1240 domain-containing protein [Proteus mirabilis]MBG3019951.1 DUF1240 domain-containing protein [Proteus mirabilis]MBG3151599.1 DUF1240 domain-containing protein [Proteus mirabilis]